MRDRVAARLSLIRGALGNDFLFCLLTCGSPRRVLEDLILFDEDGVCRFIGRFKGVTFVLMCVLRRVRQEDPFLEGDVRDPRLNLSTAFRRVLHRRVDVVALLVDLHFRP